VGDHCSTSGSLGTGRTSRGTGCSGARCKGRAGGCCRRCGATAGGATGMLATLAARLAEVPAGSGSADAIAQQHMMGVLCDVRTAEAVLHCCSQVAESLACEFRADCLLDSLNAICNHAQEYEMHTQSAAAVPGSMAAPMGTRGGEANLEAG
jgi:hypothetical protein